jgi:3'-phosphoadenosine 5'-phosphosulfate sulfotransferase (PAPS reductase)/FAD synthetase
MTAAVTVRPLYDAWPQSLESAAYTAGQACALGLPSEPLPRALDGVETAAWVTGYRDTRRALKTSRGRVLPVPTDRTAA